MQTIPVEHDRILESYTLDSRSPMAHNNASNSDWGKSNNVTSIQQSQEARCRNIACDDIPDCITSKNMAANMTSKTAKTW